MSRPNRSEDDFELDGSAGVAKGPQPLDWLLFFLRATGRRRLVASAIFLGGVALLVAFYVLRGPTYRVEARILAQRQQTLPSLVRLPGQEETPTRTAHDLVHRRDNLLALIRQAELLGATDKGGKLPALERLAGGGDEDPLERMVELLDKRLTVNTTEGTVAIQVDWPDAQQAYRIVDAALQNFLEARHVQEVTAIDETISVLRGRAAALREELDRVLDETRRNTRRQPEPEPAPRPQTPVAVSEELARLRSMVEAKERAVADVEEFRRRRLAELQAQLDAQRAVYSDAHPAVMGLRQDIAALSRESPQVAALREEERRLRQEYQTRAVHESQARPLPTPALRLAPVAGSVEENERVRAARSEYQAMLDRVGAAQMDLDSARTTFKYRYEIIWPAQVPRKPHSPKPLKVFGAGIPVALLLSILAAGLLELLRGRVQERWQVEKALDLPVIGDFRTPR